MTRWSRALFLALSLCGCNPSPAEQAAGSYTATNSNPPFSRVTLVADGKGVLLDQPSCALAFVEFRAGFFFYRDAPAPCVLEDGTELTMDRGYAWHREGTARLRLCGVAAGVDRCFLFSSGGDVR